MLNEWEGCCHYYPVCDCHRRRRGGEDRDGFGGHFTENHVSLMFSPHRDGLRRHGEYNDRIRAMLPRIMSREPHRYSIRTGTTICNL